MNSYTCSSLSIDLESSTITRYPPLHVVLLLVEVHTTVINCKYTEHVKTVLYLPFDEGREGSEESCLWARTPRGDVTRLTTTATAGEALSVWKGAGRSANQ